MEFKVKALCLFVCCALASAQYYERTFTMVKPDGVQRGLVGRIIQRFEQKGFKLTAIKFVYPTEEMLKEHYRDLAQKPFFSAFIKEISELGPVVPMVWEGLDAVKIGRLMIGERNPAASKPGTVRGDFCIQASHNSGRNVIHGSDSVEAAKREIDVWFNETELVSWEPLFTKLVYENQDNYIE